MRGARVLLLGGLYVAVAVLALNGLVHLLPMVKAQMVDVAPYTVVLEEIVVRPDGERTTGPHQTWAARSDGSVAYRLGAADAGNRTIRFGTGVHVAVNERSRVKSTTQKPLDDSWVRDPGSNCTTNVMGRALDSQGETIVEDIAGYRAARVNLGPDVTSWFALDYGCALVKQRMDFGARGSSELRLIALTPGDPDPGLFNVGDGYQEGPPSMRARRVPPDQACNEDCQQRDREYWDRLDRQYYSHRAR